MQLVALLGRDTLGVGQMTHHSPPHLVTSVFCLGEAVLRHSTLWITVICHVNSDVPLVGLSAHIWDTLAGSYKKIEQQ